MGGTLDTYNDHFKGVYYASLCADFFDYWVVFVFIVLDGLGDVYVMGKCEFIYL